MATITAKQINETGLVHASGSAISYSQTSCNSGGDEFKNTGLEFIRIYNGHSGSQTVTVTANGTTSLKNPVFGTITKSNVVKAVGAGNIAYLGPFHPFTFNDADGMVQITYSAVTALKIEVLYIDQL